MQIRAGQFVSGYVKVILAFLPLPLIIRLTEVIYLSLAWPFDWETVWLETAGLGLDYLYVAAFFLFLFPAGLLLSFLFPKGAVRIVFLMSLVLSFVWFALIKYFVTTLVPLDQVLFAYSTEEIIKIVLSSTTFDPVGSLAFLMVAGFPFLISFLIRKWQPPHIFAWIPGLCGIVAMIVIPLINPERSDFPRDFPYYVKVNKVAYACSKWTHYLITSTGYAPEMLILEKSGNKSISPALYRAAVNYQHSNPERSYYSPEFPFLRKDNTDNALGPYIELKRSPPNLVFIIIESLTPAYFGINPWFGQFMPFLDSLRKQGLYWDHCLSTSERTFNVFPAVFASLPYAHGDFLNDKTEKPNHFSLIGLLGDAGYFSSFYYGGDPGFTNYGSFLVREGLSHVADMTKTNDPEQSSRRNWFEWGYPDGEVFEYSLLAMDTLERDPRLDIFLTLSMHAPFEIPDQDGWIQKVEERIQETSLPPAQREAVSKMKMLFSTVLYTDEMLRRFFEEIKKRPGFSNTIFIITGDHSMQELHTSRRNLLEKYHVPLILYSPLIPEPAYFPDVVTHLDITPSVLALLKAKKMVQPPPYCHWLGSGLTTSTAQGSKKPIEISFAYNNMEEPEFLKNDFFISYENLFLRTEPLELTQMTNPAIRDSLLTLHADYRSLTHYVVKHNGLVPDYLYFKNTYHEERLVIDSALIFRPVITSGDFISVMRPVLLNHPYQYMDLTLRINLASESPDTLHYPLLVVEVKDSAMNILYYANFALQKTDSAAGRPVQGQSHHVAERIDIGFIPRSPHNTVKMYFWNPHKIAVSMDSLSVSLAGYFRPEFIDNQRKP